MPDSYKNGYEFVLCIRDDKSAFLKRRNSQKCGCPFGSGSEPCGSWCPHFVIENCSIMDKRCQLVLTCGKYTARYLEIAG